MQAGITVFNDNNIIQVDADFSNWVMIDKGSFYRNQVGNSTDAPLTGPGEKNEEPNTLYIIANAINPIIAVRTQRWHRIWRELISPSLWRFKITFGYGSQNSWNMLVQWYVFDKITQVSGNFGLQTFDENGNIVFNSNSKYMKVLDVVYKDEVSWFNSNNTEKYTPDNPKIETIGSYPGKDFATIFGQQACSWYEYSGGFGYESGIPGVQVRFTDNSVVSRTGLMDGWPGGRGINPANTMTKWSLMVIDVTGY